MTDREAISNFEKRNFWLKVNPCCQRTQSRVDKQNSEIERNEAAISAIKERMERKNGCTYCRKFSSGELRIAYRYELRDAPETRLTWDGCRMPVNYCPLCGNRLEELPVTIKGGRNMEGSICLKCIHNCVCDEYLAEKSYHPTNNTCLYALNYFEEREDDWKCVEDGLPKEHDSMFAQFYGTPLWEEGMFRTHSDYVLIAGTYIDGRDFSLVGERRDGIWTSPLLTSPYLVTHWKPIPKSPVEKNHEMR